MNGAAMRLFRLTAPSAWASYLIDGDTSGLDAGEQAVIDDWMKAEGVPGIPVTCEDAGFCWRHDASRVSLAGDCQTYVWLVPPGHPLFDVSESAHASA